MKKLFTLVTEGFVLGAASAVGSLATFAIVVNPRVRRAITEKTKKVYAAVRDNNDS
jgi:hypothetical protein